MNDLSRQATRLEAIEGSYDKWLLGAIIALTGVGVVMVASSSIALMSSPFYYLNRHLIFLAVGIVLAVIAARTELKSIEQYNQMLLLGCFVLLLAVFAPGLGSTVNGARRWINLGISKFQTVEAVKVLYIVWLSSYLVRFRDEVNATWPAMLKPLGVAGALVVLLLLQPDFGSSTLLLAITAGMLVQGEHAAHVDAGDHRPGRHERTGDHRAVPHAPHHLVPGPVGRPAGRRLPAVQRADGGGPWRVDRRRPGQLGAEAVLPARSAYRLHLLGHRRGIRLPGHLRDRGPVRAAGRPTFWLGMRCVEMKRHFSGYIAFGIGLWIGMQTFVDRREPGHPADQGPDPAADLFRRLVGADDLRGDGPAAARVL
jgi:cell division protein FtsW